MAHNNYESDTSTCSESEEEGPTTLKVNPQPPPPSYFGNIEVENCNNVHFGNTAVYNGAVTVQQHFVQSPYEQKVFQLNDKNSNIATICSDSSSVVCPNQGDSKQPRPHFEQQFSVIVTSSESGLTGDGEIVSCGGLRWTRRRTCVLAIAASLAVVALALALLLIVTGVVFSAPANDDDWTYDGNQTILNGTEGVAPLYSRLDWLAQPVGRGDRFSQQPVPLVIVSHSAATPCHNHSQCVFQVRIIQTFHIEGQGWRDIGYNFLVGGDGGAYEGRGWDLIGAHAFGFNNRSIGICFLGTFVTQVPPEKQMRAARLLIEEGVRLGKISEDYKLLAHRQVSPTESPGAALYAELQKWPHWVPDPNAPLRLQETALSD